MNLSMMYELGNLKIDVHIIKFAFLILYTYYSNFKITNTKDVNSIKMFLNIIFCISIALISSIIRYETNYFISILTSIFLLSILFAKNSNNNISKSIMVTTISLSINYILYIASIIINYILNTTFKLNNDYVNAIIMASIHVFLLFRLFKIRRLKNGLTFLQTKLQNEYIDILTLNVSIIILFSVIIFSNYNKVLMRAIFIGLIFSIIIMFITIQKSLQLYYKQKLLVKELEETKDQLAKKNKEIEDLEAENINISKKSHTLSHKQKSLEYKIEQMLTKAEISLEDRIEVKERLQKIKEEFNKENATIELDKTEITEIDDMLKYMQSECIKNKIDFELQIKGNIHHMTNDLIAKEDLETLLADHIKNAIIAINHTNNINRSILVRLGKVDETYSLYIYDSGVEFQKEILESLGKKSSTTHADEGGTGMGFMNTFDTLRKCKASLIIEEYNKPSKDNYTKAIIIKFDEKNEFKIDSYREKYQKI